MIYYNSLGFNLSSYKHTLALLWKPTINVNIEMFIEWVKKETSTSYKETLIFHDKLVIAFSSEIPQALAEKITAKWGSIDHNSQESLTYLSYNDKQKILNNIKSEMVKKGWDQMNQCERKVLLNLPLTNDDLINWRA